LTPLKKAVNKETNEKFKANIKLHL